MFKDIYFLYDSLPNIPNSLKYDWTIFLENRSKLYSLNNLDSKYFKNKADLLCDLDITFKYNPVLLEISNNSFNNIHLVDFSYLKSGFYDVFLQNNKKISNFFFFNPTQSIDFNYISTSYYSFYPIVKYLFLRDFFRSNNKYNKTDLKFLYRSLFYWEKIKFDFFDIFSMESEDDLDYAFILKNAYNGIGYNIKNNNLFFDKVLKTTFVDKKDFELSVFLRENFNKMEEFFKYYNLDKRRLTDNPYFFDLDDYSFIKLLYKKELNDFLFYKFLLNYNSLNKGVFSIYEYFNSKFIFFFPKRYNLLDTNLLINKKGKSKFFNWDFFSFFKGYFSTNGMMFFDFDLLFDKFFKDSDLFWLDKSVFLKYFNMFFFNLNNNTFWTKFLDLHDYTFDFLNTLSKKYSKNLNFLSNPFFYKENLNFSLRSYFLDLKLFNQNNLTNFFFPFFSSLFFKKLDDFLMFKTYNQFDLSFFFERIDSYDSIMFYHINEPGCLFKIMESLSENKSNYTELFNLLSHYYFFFIFNNISEKVEFFEKFDKISPFYYNKVKNNKIMQDFIFGFFFDLERVLGWSPLSSFHRQDDDIIYTDDDIQYYLAKFFKIDNNIKNNDTIYQFLVEKSSSMEGFFFVDIFIFFFFFFNLYLIFDFYDFFFYPYYYDIFEECTELSQRVDNLAEFKISAQERKSGLNSFFQSFDILTKDENLNDIDLSLEKGNEVGVKLAKKGVREFNLFHESNKIRTNEDLVGNQTMSNSEKNMKRVGPDYFERINLNQMINNAIVSNFLPLFFDSFDYARKAFYLLFLNNPPSPQHWAVPLFFHFIDDDKNTVLQPLSDLFDFWHLDVLRDESSFLNWYNPIILFDDQLTNNIIDPLTYASGSSLFVSGPLKKETGFFFPDNIYYYLHYHFDFKNLAINEEENSLFLNLIIYIPSFIYNILSFIYYNLYDKDLESNLSDVSEFVTTDPSEPTGFFFPFDFYSKSHKTFFQLFDQNWFLLEFNDWLYDIGMEDFFGSPYFEEKLEYSDFIFDNYISNILYENYYDFFFSNFFSNVDLFSFNSDVRFFELDPIDYFFIFDDPALVIFLLDIFYEGISPFKSFFLQSLFEKKNFYELELKSLNQLYHFLFQDFVNLNKGEDEENLAHFEFVFDKFLKDDFLVLSWYDFLEKDDYVELNPLFDFHKLILIYNHFYYDVLKFIKSIKVLNRWFNVFFDWLHPQYFDSFFFFFDFLHNAFFYATADSSSQSINNFVCYNEFDLNHFDFLSKEHSSLNYDMEPRMQNFYKLRYLFKNDDIDSLFFLFSFENINKIFQNINDFNSDFWKYIFKGDIVYKLESDELFDRFIEFFYLNIFDDYLFFQEKFDIVTEYQMDLFLSRTYYFHFFDFNQNNYMNLFYKIDWKTEDSIFIFGEGLHDIKCHIFDWFFFFDNLKFFYDFDFNKIFFWSDFYNSNDYFFEVEDEESDLFEQETAILDFYKNFLLDFQLYVGTDFYSINDWYFLSSFYKFDDWNYKAIFPLDIDIMNKGLFDYFETFINKGYNLLYQEPYQDFIWIFYFFINFIINFFFYFFSSILGFNFDISLFVNDIFLFYCKFMIFFTKETAWFFTTMNKPLYLWKLSDLAVENFFTVFFSWWGVLSFYFLGDFLESFICTNVAFVWFFFFFDFFFFNFSFFYYFNFYYFHTFFYFDLSYLILFDSALFRLVFCFFFFFYFLKIYFFFFNLHFFFILWGVTFFFRRFKFFFNKVYKINDFFFYYNFYFFLKNKIKHIYLNIFKY